MFVRYDGANEIPVDVRGIFRGQTVFIVGGSPTLLSQNYRLLSERGVVSIGINNASSVVKTTMCIMGDRPPCFNCRQLMDPSVLKFAKRVHSDQKMGNGAQWRTAPSTVFFDQIVSNVSPCDNADNFVYARNNTLEMCLSLVLTMGVSRIVLAGCSFDSGYSYGASLRPDEEKRNRLLYDQQVSTLRSLAQSLASTGVELVDSSAGSRLEGACRLCSLEDAVSEALSPLPADAPPASLSYSASLYGSPPESRKEPYQPVEDECRTPVFTGFELGVDMPGLRVLLALLTVRSLALSSPGTPLYLVTDLPEDVFETVSSKASRLFKTHSHAKITIVRLSDDTKSRIPNSSGNALTKMANFRCLIPSLFPRERRCVWLDSDCVVVDDIKSFVSEAEELGEPIVGVIDYNLAPGWNRGLNSGVLYMDLKAMRESGYDAEIERKVMELCLSGDRTADQRAVNCVPHGFVGNRWNMQMSAALNRYEHEDVYRECFKSPGIIHFTGAKNRLLKSCKSEGDVHELFRSAFNSGVAAVFSDLGPDGALDISRLVNRLG